MRTTITTASFTKEYNEAFGKNIYKIEAVCYSEYSIYKTAHPRYRPFECTKTEILEAHRDGCLKIKTSDIGTFLDSMIPLLFCSRTQRRYQ